MFYLKIVFWRVCEHLFLTLHCGSSPNLSLISSQQQVMSMKAVVGGAAVVEGEDDGEKLCRLFGNSITVDVYHALLFYKTCNVNDNMVEVSIMQLAHFNAWLGTNLNRFRQS